MFRMFLYIFALAPLLQQVSADNTLSPKVTIIIDDVGDSRALGLRAANLPSDVALSILPLTPFSREIAILGHQRGMDILLHQPMESLTNTYLLGPGALLLDMQRQQFARTLEENLNAVPHVIGINNHMGSLLTTDNEKMNWLMAELKQRAMFFIDSRTTTKTVATRAAKRWQIPVMSRRIFLDHDNEPEAIASEFQRMIRLAKKYGHVIAIGHPRKNTLDFLENNLSQLISAGVELVSTNDAMHARFANLLQTNQQQTYTDQLYSYNNCYKTDTRQHLAHSLLYAVQMDVNCPTY